MYHIDDLGRETVFHLVDGQAHSLAGICKTHLRIHPLLRNWWVERQGGEYHHLSRCHTQ